MTTHAPFIGELQARRPFPARLGPKGTLLYKLVTTTDHKLIGLMYLVTSFVFFFIGGLMALLMRAELARPGMQFLSPEQYNQLFTMHGTIMLLFFATPIVFGFANYVVPLQIGAPDVAFPRLNAFSYWLYLFGALIATVRLPHPGRRGRLRLVRLRAAVRRAINSPGRRRRPVDHGPGRRPAWAPSSAAVNMITTVICLRAPGHDDVPDADLHLEHPGHHAAGADGVPGADRGAARRWPPTGISAAHVFDPANGGAILWQHLFWFFGHPEVYIVALPFFGIVTEVIPVFSRKPVFGYKGLVFATLAIAALSIGGVGAPHVRHRRGAAAVLLVHDVPDRGADRHQVLQLDRHDVAGPDHASRRRCCSRSASWSRSCSAA